MFVDFNEVDKTLKQYKARYNKGLFSPENGEDCLDIATALRQYIKDKELK